MAETSLNDLAEKVDHLIDKGFDPQEIKTLQAIIAAWRAADGFITVTKRIGIFLAAIVLLWTQWERVLELIRAVPGKGAP